MSRRILAVAVSGLLLAAAALPAAEAGSPVDSAALLRTYLPVLFFHPEEDWAPERAEAFVSRARVEKQVASGRWTTQPPPQPIDTHGCTFSPCYRFNLPCALHSGDACYETASKTITNWKQPVIYGRVLTVPEGSPPPPGFTTPPSYLVRYWLFYEFDDWRSPRKRLWQAHEGDWESITIGLSATQQPLFAAYSEHCSGTIRAWSKVTKRDATHPVDYVALGSHANYFTNASSSTKFSECLGKYLSTVERARAKSIVKLAEDRLVDRMGTAHQSGPASLQLVELTQPLPTWARFPGRWSEGQLLWFGRTPRRLTSLMETGGPATPNWNGTSIPSYWHNASS